jgi:hypothetical protein
MGFGRFTKTIKTTMKKILFIILLPFLTKAQFGGAGSIASTKDIKALEFISPTAANITTPNQIWAICFLVKMSKGLGTWSKDQAEFPMIGGTANSHSYNLINVATNGISWFGGLTHSATGTKGNGSNGYGMVNGWRASANNTHVMFFNRTNNNQAFLTGIFDPNQNPLPYLSLEPNYQGASYFSAGDVSNQVAVTANIVVGGFGVSRTSSSLAKGYINGSVVATTTATNTLNIVNENFHLFVRQPWGGVANSSKEINSLSLGLGYTDQDMLNKYNIYNYINTVLGR